MPLYHYSAFNRQGVHIKGSLDAPSIDSVKEVLRERGLLPSNIAATLDHHHQNLIQRLFERKTDTKTVIIFTKQFAVLLRSGVPLLQSLELLTEQFEGQFRRILISIKDNVKSGESLAHELARYPSVFSNIYIQLVKAGEASGKLDIILKRLTEYLQKSEETKARVSKAMRTPMLQLSFAIFIVAGLLVFVVPKMTDMIEKMGKKLPASTQFLISLSSFVSNHIMISIFLIIALMLAGKYIQSTDEGARRIDALILRIPMIGYFSRTKAIVQFSKTFGMLLESGVNLPEALDIVTNIVDNRVLTQQLSTARDHIIKEGKIAQYLKETGIFPKIASYMINTGEQSGKLDEMLLSVGNDYEHELGDITDHLTSSIGPIMTIVMGLIIGFIVMAMFAPIIEMNNISGI